MAGRVDIENTKVVIDGDSDVVEIGMPNATQVDIGAELDLNSNDIVSVNEINGVPITSSGAGTNYLADDGAYKSLSVPTPQSFTVPSDVSVRDIVYSTGALTADKADNTSTSTIPAIGIVISKTDSTTAVVMFTGYVIGGFTGLTAGAEQFLSTEGAITETPPSTVGYILQRIGVAIDTDTLLFQPGEHYLL